ncbi:hypothetical protein BH759_03930 [Ralstonia solanacearum]|nr:hypothetical protein BH759_03930 [Ralstonia solanacearum]
MATDKAPACRIACDARSAYSQPGLSRSGQISTALPASGIQSVLSTGALAPCIAVVATMPESIRTWAHFSPSTSTTCMALASPGWLYSGRGSGGAILRRLASQGRNSFPRPGGS